MALPAYELLTSKWTQLQGTLPHYIGVGLDKLKQYINEGRKTRIKLEWLKEHWEAEDVANAREWMLQAVRHFFPCGIGPRSQVT
jgi:hypothetical protein